MAVSRRATSPAALRSLRRAELPPNADNQTKTSPHHDKLENRCGYRSEQPWRLPSCIEASASNAKRKERCGHGDDTHVHQHMREERLTCELRQWAQPDRSEDQQSDDYDTAAHQ